MDPRKSLYHRHRFPQNIIRHAVWLYYRFCLSYRDGRILDILVQKRRNKEAATARTYDAPLQIDGPGAAIPGGSYRHHMF